MPKYMQNSIELEFTSHPLIFDTLNLSNRGKKHIEPNLDILTFKTNPCACKSVNYKYQKWSNKCSKTRESPNINNNFLLFVWYALIWNNSGFIQVNGFIYVYYIIQVFQNGSRKFFLICGGGSDLPSPTCAGKLTLTFCGSMKIPTPY